ncbi:MAG: hypothetical protein ACREEM_23260 [Blastocatellia bacterium]
MTRYSFRLLTLFALLIGAFGIFNTTALAQYPIGTSHLSDIKPGSVLFYNRYTSNPSNPQQGDTQINITNTSQNLDVTLHLFLVDGSTCSVADSFVSLTPNQTASFLMSDYDPGIQGYLVAVAVDGGAPAQFNFMIGDAYIRETDGRQYNLPAVAVAKRSPGAVEASGEGMSAMIFNDAEYERLPASLALSSFNSQATDNTQVHLYSPSANLIIGAAPSTVSIFTLVYDDAERVFSTTTRFVCYGTFNLSSLRVVGGSLNTLVPAGRTGWIRFNGGGRPLLGAVAQRGAVFQGGHNLHTLTTLSTFTINIPAFGI